MGAATKLRWCHGRANNASAASTRDEGSGTPRTGSIDVVTESDVYISNGWPDPIPFNRRELEAVGSDVATRDADAVESSRNREKASGKDVRPGELFVSS